MARRWKRCASSGADPEVLELDLGLRPRQRALRARRSPARGTCRPAPSAASRVSATTVAKLTRAVAPGGRRTRRRRLTIGSSTAPAVFDRGRPSIDRSRVADAAAAAEEAGAVGLELHAADRLALDGGDVGHPDARLLRAPRPPGGEERLEPRDELGLDEEVREGGVRDVGGPRREDDLGVGGQLDLPRARSRGW